MDAKNWTTAAGILSGVSVEIDHDRALGIRRYDYRSNWTPDQWEEYFTNEIKLTEEYENAKIAWDKINSPLYKAMK